MSLEYNRPNKKARKAEKKGHNLGASMDREAHQTCDLIRYDPGNIFAGGWHLDANSSHSAACTP